VTVIAYRDGVMAADKLAVRGAIRSNLKTKISRRADGALIGACGSAPLTERYRRWFLEGEDALRRPAMMDGEQSAGALVVRPDGGVEEHTHWGVEPMEGPFFAVGCGANFALAAMEMGADAVRAVEVAAKFDIHCGGGVDVLRLDAEAVALAAE
jgi:hypothetical protein